MGIYFTQGATKEQIVEELLTGIAVGAKLVDHAQTFENGQHILWTVEEGDDEDARPFFRVIRCYVLVPDKFGWGYKPLCETVGPCYYSVPQEWLEKYPCVLPEPWVGYSKRWRMKCKLKKQNDTK